MVIDFHVHCFPDTLAPRALAALSEHVQAEGFPCTDGTQSGTEAHIASQGVDYAVVCNIATNSRQQHNVNSFAISIAKSSKTLYSLGSLHPHGEDKRGELLRLREAGIRGIKIHPDYIGIDITDPAYYEIFELCSELGFFVLMHAGFDPVSPGHVHASPGMIATVAARYPGLKLIAAHMGGYLRSGEVIEHLLGKDIWLDTSMSSQRPDEYDNLVYILKNHSPDRLLFASDTPWSYAAEELKFIHSAKLRDDLTEKILYKNALALLEG
ncbi:MAG: amidohydrolase family protein [Clostridiales bacterium]|nr:amidohydrolase family protein [Clostridiales bacterium]